MSEVTNIKPSSWLKDDTIKCHDTQDLIKTAVDLIAEGYSRIEINHDALTIIVFGGLKVKEEEQCQK